MVPAESTNFGQLLAWDPIKQKAAWKVDHIGPNIGGTLSTVGNLVFQGTADGRFVAYNATNGDKLWEEHVGTGVIAAPVTYEVDGQQYVSIAAGWGGGYGLIKHHSESQSPGRYTLFPWVVKHQCLSWQYQNPNPS